MESVGDLSITINLIGTHDNIDAEERKKIKYPKKISVKIEIFPN